MLESYASLDHNLPWVRLRSCPHEQITDGVALTRRPKLVRWHAEARSLAVRDLGGHDLEPSSIDGEIRVGLCIALEAGGDVEALGRAGTGQPLSHRLLRSVVLQASATSAGPVTGGGLPQ